MMLKSARQALHTLQSSSRPAASSALQSTRNETTQIRSNPKVQWQCALPGGFFCLNPNVETTSQRPPQPQVTHVEAQASKPQPQPQPSTCFLPIFPVNAPTLQATSKIERRASISQKPKQIQTPLKKENLDIVSKDSRLARWQRVLAFVHDQRLSTPEPSSEKPTRPVTAPAEATVQVWDNDEDDKRSLWSGGSAGTNGVNEYVWDEDMEEPAKPQITLVPEPKLANRPAFVPLCLTPEVSYVAPPPPAPKPMSRTSNEYEDHVPQDEGIFVLDAEENENIRQEDVKTNPLNIHSPLMLNPVTSFMPSRNPWDLPKDLKRRFPRVDDGWNKRWTVAEIGL